MIIQKKKLTDFRLHRYYFIFCLFKDEDVLLACFTLVVNAMSKLAAHQSSAAVEKLLEKAIIPLIDLIKDDDALAAPICDAARKTFRLLLRRKRLHSAALYALKVRDADLLVELICHARAAGDQPALVNQATSVLDSVRAAYTSGSSTSSGSTRSSYTISSSGSSSSSSSRSRSSSCSTCDDNHTPPDASDVVGVQSQLSNVQLGTPQSAWIADGQFV